MDTLFNSVGLCGINRSFFYRIPQLLSQCRVHAIKVHRLVKAFSFLDIVSDAGQQRDEFLNGFGLMTGIRKASAADRCFESKIQKRLRLSAGLVISFGPVLANKVVRILAVREDEYFDLEIMRQQMLDRASCGLYAGIVAVVINNDAFGKTA